MDGIKGRTVGDGQHGTARFAGKGEIRRTFHRVRFRPRAWRRGKHLPKVQGLVVGCEMRGKRVTALVDGDDIHAMMVAGSGAGKTAYFLYPNLEYCCAAGMSFLTSDTKGDLARNYAGIAKDIYGYDVSVLDLRNPACSDGNNLLDLVNKYMDAYMAHRTIWQAGRGRRSMRRSLRKRSSHPAAGQSMDRTPISMTRPKASSPP